MCSWWGGMKGTRSTQTTRCVLFFVAEVELHHGWLLHHGTKLFKFSAGALPNPLHHSQRDWCCVCECLCGPQNRQAGNSKEELLPNSIMASAATVGGGMQAWQHPFCDLFKHVDVDKWQQSDRAGNVTKVLVSP